MFLCAHGLLQRHNNSVTVCQESPTLCAVNTHKYAYSSASPNRTKTGGAVAAQTDLDQLFYPAPVSVTRA